MHHSSTSTYVLNFVEIEGTFCGRTDGHFRHVIRSTRRNRPKKIKQVVKEFKRKVAPQSCHPSRRLMDSSDVDLHLVRAYWAHMSQPPYGISIGSAVFAYTAAKTPPMLCNRPDIPQNYPFPLRYLDPHLIHGSV